MTLPFLFTRLLINDCNLLSIAEIKFYRFQEDIKAVLYVLTENLMKYRVGLRVLGSQPKMAL